MAEWSKAADCKSVGNTHVGSNPTLLILFKYSPKLFFFRNRIFLKKKIIKNYKKLRKDIYLKEYLSNRTTKNVEFISFSKKLKTSFNIENFRIFSAENLIVRPNFNQNLVKVEERINSYDKVLSKVIKNRLFLFHEKTLENLVLNLHFNIFDLSLILSRLTSYVNLSLFKKHNKHYNVFKKILMLNFRRNRFFPSLQSSNHFLYTTFSLGMFSKFFKKGKAFIKNKANFLVIAGFLRKILMYADINDIILMVKRTPLYLTEILSTINSPVVANYKNPFNSDIVDEMRITKNFFYHYFIFFNTRAYGYMKTRKKGRIKRKITKRVVKINRLTD